MALSQENAKWFADTFTRIVDNVGEPFRVFLREGHGRTSLLESGICGT